MIIKPYGRFKVKWLDKPSLKNCDKCWFGQTNNGIHHCPEKFKCVVNGRARVFIKL